LTLSAGIIIGTFVMVGAVHAVAGKSRMTYAHKCPIGVVAVCIRVAVGLVRLALVHIDTALAAQLISRLAAARETSRGICAKKALFAGCPCGAFINIGTGDAIPTKAGIANAVKGAGRIDAQRIGAAVRTLATFINIHTTLVALSRIAFQTLATKAAFTVCTG
jgi:hypothetical protein